MHQEHAKPTVISRNRNSLLRALMERLRGRTVSRAGRAEVETGILLDQSRSMREGRERWAAIARGLHHPDEPVVLDEEGSREVLDEIVNGSPLTPERRATFERMRLMAEVHRRSELLESGLRTVE